MGQSLTLCAFCPRVPSPRGGGYSLAVRGQLQVIRPHFEEVQQVWAAGDLHGQSHEAAEVLSERALAALGGTLPIKPPGCWVGGTRDPRAHSHKSKRVWKGRAEEGPPGQATLLRASGYLLPGRCGMTLFSVWISPASMGNISLSVFYVEEENLCWGSVAEGLPSMREASVPP